jgi:IS30 family transposase
MRKYDHLGLAQRCEIFCLKKQGMSARQIAERLDVHSSTVYRELKRNSLKGEYGPRLADVLSKKRRRMGRRCWKMNAKMWGTISTLLRRYYSPEQVCGWLRSQGMACVCVETIYAHIYRDGNGSLRKYLRRHHKRRRRGKGQKRPRTRKIRGSTPIGQRPAEVAQRQVMGHWEMDLMLGAGRAPALLVLVERVSRYVKMTKVDQLDAAHVAAKAIELMEPYSKRIYTITCDNGSEFALHKRISKAIKCRIYFADPHQSWQRGTVENTIGLVRQFFPKRTSLKDIDPRRVKQCARRLNTRPRKVLGYAKPSEVFRPNPKKMCRT